MDRLVSITENVASQSSEINEEMFTAFMRECPIWDYYRITQTAYLAQSHDEKMRLISNYYKKMSEGKIRLIFLFVCLFSDSLLHFRWVFELLQCLFRTKVG